MVHCGKFTTHLHAAGTSAPVAPAGAYGRCRTACKQATAPALYATQKSSMLFIEMTATLGPPLSYQKLPERTFRKYRPNPEKRLPTIPQVERKQDRTTSRSPGTSRFFLVTFRTAPQFYHRQPDVNLPGK